MGVLKVAQSVIDLLSHSFPQAINILKPETSNFYGVAPVLLKPRGADKDAITTLFGNSGGEITSFGAEQVILVRDELLKKEVSSVVGNKALVLTVLECKGLEFQDVLLYNFFVSSPLGDQWSVIYEFMEREGRVDMPFPRFCEERHMTLCYELMQLYVAITRSRKRLWICESREEFFKPMFDYWKELRLVETREIDDSLAQAIQISSTPEEWKSQGVKLLGVESYEMAIMCFEKAGESMLEKRAKAAGFRTAAQRIRHSNPEEAATYLHEAAEIFYSIEMFPSAATCFYDSQDYERAGKIYLDKFTKPQRRKAAECFTLAGLYEQAAKVYAQGRNFAELFSVCIKGKCFQLGLNCVREYWKQHGNNTMGIETDEIKKIGEFLEICAANYFELNDRGSMMKCLESFPSMDMKRKFLKSVECLDELLELEEEAGNTSKVADIRNFLSESKDLDSTKFFDKVFPLNHCKLLEKNIISLRRNEFSKGLLHKFIQHDIRSNKDQLSYGQIGRVMMIWLASGIPSEDLCNEIVERTSEGPWKNFMNCLSFMKEYSSVFTDLDLEPETESEPEPPLDIYLVAHFHYALEETFNVYKTRQYEDHMSPGCFLYLLECFCLLVSRLQGSYFTKISSAVEWLISKQSEEVVPPYRTKSHNLEKYNDLICEVVEHLLNEESHTLDWISRSEIQDCAFYKVLVLRLVVIMNLLCLNNQRKYSDHLITVLRYKVVKDQLKEELRSFNSRDVSAFFRVAGDQLCYFNASKRPLPSPYCIHVPLGKNCNREDIIELLLTAQAPNSENVTSCEEQLKNLDLTSESKSSNQSAGRKQKKGKGKPKKSKFH